MHSRLSELPFSVQLQEAVVLVLRQVYLAPQRSRLKLQPILLKSTSTIDVLADSTSGKVHSRAEKFGKHYTLCSQGGDYNYYNSSLTAGLWISSPLAHSGGPHHTHDFVKGHSIIEQKPRVTCVGHITAFICAARFIKSKAL